MRQRSADYPVGDDDDDALSLASICFAHPSTVAAAAIAAVIELVAAIDAAADDAAKTAGVAATCAAVCSDDGSRPRLGLDYCRSEPNLARMYLRW